jgi:hypothetical protein
VPKTFSAAGRAPFPRTRPDRPAFQQASRPRPSFEPLEGRTHFSVALDASGFTVVTPEGNSRVVYVSSSMGNDANDGLSPAAPVQTLDHAESLLRDKSGDQMLLARGDVWHEPLGDWTKSGRSADQPIVIGAYGPAGARPRLETGTGNAFSIQSPSANVKHLVIQGVALVASARVPGSPDFLPDTDGGNGLRILSRVDDLLVEDCFIQAYNENVLLQDFNGPQSNVTVRRSVVVDAYSTDDGHSQGLYAYGVSGLLLEGNLFDHNGWSETVPNAPATMYNHNIYLSSTNSGVVVRDNVIANASSHGLQARSGGRVENNVFIDNPIGMSFGLVRGATVTPGGVSGVVNGNVFLGTRTINGAGRGNGMEIGNIRANIPTVVSNNIFADANVAAGKDYALTLSYPGDGADNGEQAAGINDLTVQGNVVYRWSKGIRFDTGFVPGGTGRTALNRVTIRANDFQQVLNERLLAHDSPLDPAQEKWEANRYDATAGDEGEIFVGGKGITPEKWTASHEPTAAEVRAAYADPDRTADTYASVTTGVPSRAILLAELRASSSQYWRPQFTAGAMVVYVRGGFEQPGGAPRDWRAPTAPIAVASPPAIPTAGDAVVTFTVTYGDDKSVDPATLDAGDVRLVGRKGKVDVPASVAAVQGGGDGQPLVVTYAAAAPDGSWDRRDRGNYSVVANERQVFDSEGFFVAAGELEHFKLRVAPRPKPPRVVKSAFTGKGEQSFTVWFSSDVGTTIGVDDLLLRTEDGTTAIDTSPMSFTYDAARRAATWTFAGLPGAALPAGRYRATLLGAGITDAAGQPMGGDYVVRQALRV